MLSSGICGGSELRALSVGNGHMKQMPMRQINTHVAAVLSVSYPPFLLVDSQRDTPRLWVSSPPRASKQAGFAPARRRAPPEGLRLRRFATRASHGNRAGFRTSYGGSLLSWFCQTVVS